MATGHTGLDSLRALAFDRTTPDSLRFTAFYDLVWDGYLFSDPDSAYILATSLRREARAKNNKVFEARASELFAAVWYVRGDMRTALLHYDTALALHKRNMDHDGQADVLTNMASMLSYLGDLDSALALYNEGLALHERLRDSAGIATDLNALGRVQMLRGDHARAVELYMRSLSIQEQLGNKRGICTSLANLGGLYLNQSDWKEALDHYRRAATIAEELDDKHQLGKQLEEIGSCLEELGDTAQAMRVLRRSEAVRMRIDDRHGLVNVRNRIAGLLVEQGRYSDALEFYNSAEAMARTEDLPWGLGNALVGISHVLLLTAHPEKALRAALAADSAALIAEELNLRRDAAEVKYAALKDLGRWQEALSVHERIVQLSDSIMREENQREVLRNGYRYAYEKQAERDSLDHALAMFRAESSHRQQRSTLGWLLALLSLVAISIALRVRYVSRAKRALEDAQVRLVESERAREASEVRTRIARDVHDQLGSDLTKLVLLSTEAKEVAQTNTTGMQDIANDIERIAGEANRSLGDIVWSIDPHHDSLAGLTERVRAHCERMLKWSKVEHTIDCVHEGPDRSLDPATKRDIYLMLREALNNAIKYAQAKHISVRFRTSSVRVEFEVKDDGVGMDPANSNGHGLENLRQRAERIGGTISVNSLPGMGACVEFNWAMATQ
ncbi:MAG: sensor histidine kinase [Flavobacteriales bacterium]|nr:sensor histidine kinase [Flavobacteriales bacterium]MBK7942910.1 sensor histidine kinase [Flavobacteriales bacterium]MBK9698690.1 sensor histidine kinase [Flavobacteriales bacterium]